MDAQVDTLPVATLGNARVAAEVALVLQAIGLAYVTERLDDGRYQVRVAARDRETAESALSAYARENVPAPPAPAPRPLASGAAWAVLAFLVIEYLIAVAASRGLWSAAWVERGVLDGVAVRAGEWWRPVTSLTLHADFAHLLANLGFGSVFLGLAARVYGAGVAPALALGAAVAAGSLEALGLPPGSTSLGASTAVFAALGLLAPVRWPARGRLQPWMARAATFAAALCLLGLLGAGDPRVDVTAHALGFVFGVLAGWPLRRTSFAAPRVQRVSAVAGLLLVLCAWAAALSSAA